MQIIIIIIASCLLLALAIIWKLYDENKILQTTVQVYKVYDKQNSDKMLEAQKAIINIYDIKTKGVLTDQSLLNKLTNTHKILDSKYNLK